MIITWHVIKMVGLSKIAQVGPANAWAMSSCSIALPTAQDHFAGPGTDEMKGISLLFVQMMQIWIGP